jgi:hypothetical protein
VLKLPQKGVLLDLNRSVQGSPIFIIGAPRSGTTLLQYMLRSHPRISLPTGESHFIVPLYRKASMFGDLRDPANIRKVLEEMYRRNAGFLDTDLHGIDFDIDHLVGQLHTLGVESIPNLIRTMMELNARGEGKNRWGDKTPYYSLHVPLLLEMFPDAQVIHIIRDGRDCAMSMLGRGKDLDIHNIYQAASIWKQYVDAGQQSGSGLGSSQYYEFRYEDLLGEPLKAVSGICDFLGEEFSESIINYRKSSGSGKTPLLQKPIQAGNSGKWRSTMSARQVKVFESVAGGTLVANGYELASSRQGMGRPVAFLYRLHQRLASRQNQRGRRRRAKS